MEGGYDHEQPFHWADLFNELDRVQRQVASLFGGFPSSIRSGRFGASPPVNIGATDNSIEIVAPPFRVSALTCQLCKFEDLAWG